MEITDFLKAARSRVWLIIALPVVSAAFAVGVLLGQPVEYSATSTVDPSALVGSTTSQYSGAQAVEQFVAAFQATASGPKVRNAVASDTGSRPAEVMDGLSVTQRGGSASVLLTYTTPDRSKAEPVVQAVTARTLTAMFSSQVGMAQTRLAAAQKVLDDANAAVAQFVTTSKLADPQKAYESQLTRVNGLVQQQALLRANGDTVAAAALSSSITAGTATLETFSKTLSDYNALTQRQSLADQGVATAQDSLGNATAQLAAAEPTTVAFFSGARQVNRVEAVLQVTVAVAIAAFLLGLLLILVQEVIRRARATSAVTPAHGPAASASMASAGHHARTEAATGEPTAGEHTAGESSKSSKSGPPEEARAGRHEQPRIKAGSGPR